MRSLEKHREKIMKCCDYCGYKLHYRFFPNKWAKTCIDCLKIKQKAYTVTHKFAERTQLRQLRTRLKMKKREKDNSPWFHIFGKKNQTRYFFCDNCRTYLPPCRFIIISDKEMTLRGRTWVVGHICDECTLENEFAKKIFDERASARKHLRRDLPFEIIDGNESLIDEKVFEIRIKNILKNKKKNNHENESKYPCRHHGHPQ